MSMINSQPVPHNTLGQLRMVTKTVTGPASYTAGGWSVTPQTVGLAQIVTVIPQIATTGYTLTYNHATQKLMVFGQSHTTGALIQAVNSTDLSGSSWKAVFIGV